MIRTHFGQHPGDCFGCKVATITFRGQTAFKPHFNYSVGAHVDTEKQFKSLLRQRAVENSVATGTDHVYEMRDPAELARETPPGDTEILNTQSREIAKKYAQ